MTLKLTPREERIETLLSWYKDALETMTRSGDLAYGGRPGSVCLLMGELWWHPSYRELNRVLDLLKVAEPRLWWHVRERFVTNTNRTVLVCPVCDDVQEISSRHFHYNEEQDKRTVTLRHKHAGRTAHYVLKTIPVMSKAIRPEMVEEGIRWISDRFAYRTIDVPDFSKAA